jgi:hypothetical protein
MVRCVATPDQLLQSWWPWYTMEFIKDDESAALGERGERIYVKPDLVTWPILIKVKDLLVQDLLRARRRGRPKHEADRMLRLQALEHIEREFETIMRQAPTMTLKEASAAWMADHLSRAGATITVHRACQVTELEEMCPDCRRRILSALRQHLAITTEVLDDY